MLLDLIPNPITVATNVAQTAVGIAAETVDYGLKTTAAYAEKADHLVRPVTHKTELIHTDESSGNYHGPVAQFIDGLRQQIKRGLPITLSLQNAAAVVDALAVSKAAGGEDDRLFLLEYVLVFLSRYPEKTVVGRTIQDKIIGILFNDLAHPVASQVGRKYKYRSADGSGNSLWHPDMGKAGSSYARSVQGEHPLPPSDLPSPELIFDTLLKREKQEDHPAGLSSFFFAFANLVIHQLFSTDHFSQNGEAVNKTSSYLDLSIIYGNNQKEQDSVRDKAAGRGKLYPDCFADARLLGMPPSTPALCVLFSRNHNYVAEKLLEINERKEWNDPPKPESSVQQDEDIFQTARLINCGFFMSTILSDYLACILGLVREGNSWSLDPLSSFRNSDHSISERGSGNLVSVEFAALYHFHSSISGMDEKWAEVAFRKYLGDTPWDEITPTKFKNSLGDMFASWGRDPRKWAIGEIKRNEDNRFADKDLARLIQEATAYPASAFKARGTPHVMRVIEIMAIEQQRSWGACSLNEFRKFLNLKPYSTFEEWNPRPDVAEAARRLYSHPDNIELYVGLQAEESKPVREGTGLCAGYTLTRSILADAVALVRGDRHLTSDFTAANLTAWGLHDAKRDPNNSANGGTVAKLLMRTLPDYFPDDSVYTEFPFMTPGAMKTSLTKIGTAHKYTYDRPVRRKPIQSIKNYEDAVAIMASDSFKTEYVENARSVMPPHRGYLLTLNDLANNNADRRTIMDSFATASAVKKQMDYMGTKTAELIKTKSYTLVGGRKRSVNIVRDVINLLPVHLVSDHVVGLPLKTENHQFGTFYEMELYEKLKDVYSYIFLQNEPTTHIARQESVKDIVNNLVRLTGHHLARLRGLAIPGIGLVDAALHFFLNQSTLSHDWIKRLRANSVKSDFELVNDVVSLAIVVSVELSQVLTHIVDKFLPASTQPDLDDESRALNLQTVAIGKAISAMVAAASQATETAAATAEAKGASADVDAALDNKQDKKGKKATTTSTDTAGSGSSAGPSTSDGASTTASPGIPKIVAPQMSAERRKEIDDTNKRSAAFVLLATSTDPSAIPMLKSHIAEALRLAPGIPGVYRDAVTDVSANGKMYKRGDRLYLSIVDAQSDLGAANRGPDFNDLSQETKLPATSLLGDGLLGLLGQDWVINMAVPVVKTIFSLKGINRAAGYSGELTSFTMEVDRTAAIDPVSGADVPGTSCHVRSYLGKDYAPTPFSSGLTITYSE